MALTLNSFRPKPENSSTHPLPHTERAEGPSLHLLSGSPKWMGGWVGISALVPPTINTGFPRSQGLLRAGEKSSRLNTSSGGQDKAGKGQPARAQNACGARGQEALGLCISKVMANSIPAHPPSHHTGPQQGNQAAGERHGRCHRAESIAFGRRWKAKTLTMTERMGLKILFSCPHHIPSFLYLVLKSNQINIYIFEALLGSLPGSGLRCPPWTPGREQCPTDSERLTLWAGVSRTDPSPGAGGPATLLRCPRCGPAWLCNEEMTPQEQQSPGCAVP